MKKFLMTFAFVSMALTLAASHPNPSELILSLHDGAAFNLTVDNRTFHQQASSYTIADLRPGKHYIEVMRFDRSFNGLYYVMGAPRVVFSGNIQVPARKRLFAHIDHRNRFVVTEKVALRPVQVNHGPAHYPATYRVVMSPQAFKVLKESMANIRFESRRLELAQHAIITNNVTSAQISELMGLFAFESNRLTLAKVAYTHTVDPQNYFLVHRAFRFSSSSRDLNRFIVSNH
ncbi:MAG: DUF4476 domain-containing protein [Bacteroidales bacterium]|nr:DUF4476 domain-containing protein [Bacteroidales bacterium]NLM93439.1 DUF4476 domain-containing protein [Bacteroidales bacterium]